MKRIVNALTTLIKAAGVGSINMSNLPHGQSVAFHADTEADALAIAGRLGIELSHNGNLTHQWLRGACDVDGVSVMVFGPHVERKAPAVADDAAIAAAVAQAEEAVTP